MSVSSVKWMKSMYSSLKALLNSILIIGRREFIQTGNKFYAQQPISKRNKFKGIYFFIPAISFVESKNNESPASDITPEDVEDNVSHMLALARMALEQGDIDRAEAILEMGMKICEEYRSYFALPYIYDILAAISFGRGNFEKSERLLVAAIEKLVQIGIKDNDSHMIDFKLRLARIASIYNDLDMAEIGFKNCLNQQLAKIQEGDTSTRTGILYVNILFWYGLHKVRSKDLASASQLINTAYSYSTKIKGLNSYQEMVILYTLAEINYEMEKYDVALENIESAIVLGKGTGSADLPKCYVKQAKIYVKLKAFDSALNAVQEGKKLAVLFNEKTTIEDADQVLDIIFQAQNEETINK